MNKLYKFVVLSILLIFTLNFCSCSDSSNSKNTKHKITYSVVPIANYDYGELPCMQELQKRTGIDVDFLPVPAVNYAERCVSTGVMPDIIEMSTQDYSGGPEAMLNDGVAVPLNDIIDKYCPNFKKYLQENPEIDKMVKTDNGVYYCFPGIYNDEFLQVFYGFIVRQDYLDKLGITAPETIEEWHTMLVKFKNELKLQVPFSFQSSDINFLMQAYGTIPDLYVDDGMIKLGVFEPGFKECMKTLHLWYEEGLLSSSIPRSLDYKITQTNMINGYSGVSYGATGGGIGTWTSLASNVKNFKLAPLKYPVLKKGDIPMYGQRIYAADLKSTAIITPSCKDVKSAAKLLDYAYGKEGLMLFNFGIEGVSYTMVNGYPTYTDLVKHDKKGRTFGEMMQYYARPHGAGPSIRDKRYMEQNSSLPEQKESIKIWSQTKAKEHMLPPLTLTVKEYEKIGLISHDIKEYIADSMNKFIMGVEPLENIDLFLNNLKNMGSDEYVTIYQQAYERYCNRK